MLKGGGDGPTRAYIEKVILSQYDRLRAEMSETGAKALAVMATSGTLGHQKLQPAPSKSE